MDRQRIEEVVTQVLQAVLQREFPAGAEITRADTPGWDSLKHMELVFAIEDELGVEFPEEVLGELDSAARIVQAVLDLHAP